MISFFWPAIMLCSTSSAAMSYYDIFLSACYHAVYHFSGQVILQCLPFSLLSCCVALQRPCDTTLLAALSIGGSQFHASTAIRLCITLQRSLPPRTMQLSTLQGLYRRVTICIDNQRFGSWPTVTPFIQDEGLTGLHISVIPFLDLSSYRVLGLLLI